MLSSGAGRFEVSRRVRATAFGGIGLVHGLARAIGVAERIDASVTVFRGPGPYAESDHVLNLTYNLICGGRTLDDLELRRQDEAYMDALGATRVPDPTTAGDFLRRFDPEQVDNLAEAINDVRVRVWKQQPAAFFEQAVIDVDGTITETFGECKEGMDMSYKGVWGYAPLLVTLANTGEILYTRTRPGNRPSHDGCFAYLNPAVELALDAGFKSVRLRGDCHFALTEDFDHWSDRGVEFVFGLAAHPKLVDIAELLERGDWEQLERDVRGTGGRGAPKPRVKQAIVEARGYKDIQLEAEHLAEFAYRPVKCEREYRVVALRKTITVREGQRLLIPDVRFHFYITNATTSSMSSREVVRQANERCNQENLIEQSKNGFHAMRMPCDTLVANDAYLLIACLAWNLKAWLALLWPEQGRAEDLRRMEFRRFVACVIALPCQVVTTGRRIVQRFLGYSSWLGPVLRAHEHLACLRLA